MSRLVVAVLFLCLGSAMARAETLNLYAAGSLKRALGDIARAYESASGDTVTTALSRSGRTHYGRRSAR